MFGFGLHVILDGKVSQGLTGSLCSIYFGGPTAYAMPNKAATVASCLADLLVVLATFEAVDQPGGLMLKSTVLQAASVLKHKR